MKIILLSLLLSTVSLFSCWFSLHPSFFINNYISGANNYKPHITSSNDLNTTNYIGWQVVDLPITVFVKIQDYIRDDAVYAITSTVLQYKYKNKSVGEWSNWITVKEIINPAWHMSFTNPITLFGIQNIDIPDLEAESEIIIRFYITDGILESGNIEEDIIITRDDNVIPNIEVFTDYGNGWTSPFVFKVIYSGTRRPIIHEYAD